MINFFEDWSETEKKLGSLPKNTENNPFFEQFEISEPREIPPEGFAFQGNNLINVNWFKSVSWLMK